jgi:hypothetical protein
LWALGRAVYLHWKPGALDLNRAGQGRFRAFSAGSHPKGYIHRFAIELLEQLHYDVNRLRSESWTEVTGPDGFKLDFHSASVMM